MEYEKLTVPTIRKRLDTLIKNVRYRDSEDGETNICATCRRKFPIKELQCGHFIKRGNQVLKYQQENLMPQCRRCNHFLDGAQDKAAYYILRKFGIYTFAKLVETDFEWLDGKLTPPKKKDLVESYNMWLKITREEELKWGKKLIPTSWKNAE